MATENYDLIIVGGGIGGSSLAKAMAEHGSRVLVLERTQEFTDRVRGEVMVSWGAAETRALGIETLLQQSCAHELNWWDLYLGATQIAHRDLLTTTPQHAPFCAFYHPDMQETLLQAAQAVGADVRRGASVRGLTPGTRPSVTVESNGQVEEIRARLVVGADGRSSMVRKWANFQVRQDPELMMISGVLFEDMLTPHEDTAYYVINPEIGQGVPLFPQGDGRVRAYLVQPAAVETRLQGTADLPRFIEGSIRTGAPAEWYAGAKAVGPLATFYGADSWVAHPYQDGIALIGDAAATSDPAWGQGLSLTVRDVRTLRDELLTHGDWETAGHTYAEAHDQHYDVIHTVDNWYTEIFFAQGADAEARRAKALPLIAEEGERIPDHPLSGPDLPMNETVRRRFFGEE